MDSKDIFDSIDKKTDVLNFLGDIALIAMGIFGLNMLFADLPRILMNIGTQLIEKIL